MKMRNGKVVYAGDDSVFDALEAAQRKPQHHALKNVDGEINVKAVKRADEWGHADTRSKMQKPARVKSAFKSY